MLRIRFAGLAAAVLLGMGSALAQQAPAAPAIAPGDLPPASHLKVSRDVLNLSGTAAPIGGIFDEFRNNIRQSLVTRPEMHKDLDAVLQALKPEVDKRSEEMIGIASLIQARTLNEADLKEIKAFFESPVGKRYIDVRTQIVAQFYSILQPWTIQMSDFMFKYVQEEMKKRGHDIGG